MMREIGPVRKQFTGDTELAKGYTGQALVLLGVLKSQMSFGQLAQLSRQYNFPGVVITVESINGQDAIAIDVSENAGNAGERSAAKAQLPHRWVTSWPAAQLVVADAGTLGTVLAAVARFPTPYTDKVFATFKTTNTPTGNVVYLANVSPDTGTYVALSSPIDTVTTGGGPPDDFHTVTTGRYEIAAGRITSPASSGATRSVTYQTTVDEFHQPNNPTIDRFANSSTDVLTAVPVVLNFGRKAGAVATAVTNSFASEDVSVVLSLIPDISENTFTSTETSTSTVQLYRQVGNAIQITDVASVQSTSTVSQFTHLEYDLSNVLHTHAVVEEHSDVQELFTYAAGGVDSQALILWDVRRTIRDLSYDVTDVPPPPATVTVTKTLTLSIVDATGAQQSVTLYTGAGADNEVVVSLAPSPVGAYHAFVRYTTNAGNWLAAVRANRSIVTLDMGALTLAEAAKALGMKNAGVFLQGTLNDTPYYLYDLDADVNYALTTAGPVLAPLTNPHPSPPPIYKFMQDAPVFKFNSKYASLK